MTITRSLAELQKEHVVLELECIDRMYLNAYVPKLTTEGGIAAFCRGYFGHRFASTKQAVAMTDAFIKSIATFIQKEGLEFVRFKKGQRKDDVLQKKLRQFKKDEGVIFVGVAQEKVRVPRTTRRQLPEGGTIPWIMYSTGLINVYSTSTISTAGIETSDRSFSSSPPTFRIQPSCVSTATNTLNVN